MTSRTNYYKTVSQVYSFKNIADKLQQPAQIHLNDEVNNLTPLETINRILSLSDRDIINFDNSDIRLNSNIPQRINIPDAETKPEVTENFVYKTDNNTDIPQNVSKIETFIEEVKTTEKINTPTCSYHNMKASNNPLIWGPPFWYTIHNGVYHYPEHAGPLHIERMKNFILAIPIMLPCTTCKEHATAFIDKHRKKLDTICSGKDLLFKFFVDFHNQVNKRYGKPELSYDEAYNIYKY